MISRISMAKARQHLLYAVMLLGLLCLGGVRVRAADPDPVQDLPILGVSSADSTSLDFSFDGPGKVGFHTHLNNSTGGGAAVDSFTFRNFVRKGDVSQGPGGRRSALNPTIFPGMKGQGITIVRFHLVPCGINLPHTHPRASEMLTLLSGGPLQVGFVDTKGVSHIDILNPGDVTVFPRGLLHYELNVGTETAKFLSSLNSENPGTLTAAGALFGLPDRALATALNIGLEQVQALRTTLYPYNGPNLQKNDASRCIPGKDLVLDF